MIWQAARLRMQLGNLAIPDPATAHPPSGFRGIPQARGEGRVAGVECPTGALKDDGSLDLGACICCGNCSRGEEAPYRFSDDPRLAATTRQALVLRPGESGDAYAARAVEARPDLARLFGRSLKLRQVSAGGCNACELELNACGNLNFDMGRYGIEFVASPRHADGIVITGPVSAAMAGPLADTLAAVPEPRIVIACGACAISGGPFAGSPALDRSFFARVPVDLYIPGCPAHPLSVIQAILALLGRR